MPDAASPSNGADPDASRHRHRAQGDADKPEQSASCQTTSSGVLGEFFFFLVFGRRRRTNLKRQHKRRRSGQVAVEDGSACGAEQCAHQRLCLGVCGAREPRVHARLQAAPAWKVIRCVVCQHDATFSVVSELLSSGPRETAQLVLRAGRGGRGVVLRLCALSVLHLCFYSHPVAMQPHRHMQDDDGSLVHEAPPVSSLYVCVAGATW